MRVVAATLAAGAATRMGRAKQTLELDGEAMVRRVTRSLCEAQCCAQVAVIVGAHASEVQAALHGMCVQIVQNDAWQTGLASSIAAAVSWADETRSDALLLAAADQPLLGAEHVRALVSRWVQAPEAGPMASAYAGIVGIPALFPRSWFGRLSTLAGDRGAGALLRTSAVRTVAWEDGACDVDVEEDLARVLMRRERARAPARSA